MADALTWDQVAAIMGWNAIVAASDARREPDGDAARVMRVANAAAEAERFRLSQALSRSDCPA